MNVWLPVIAKGDQLIYGSVFIVLWILSMVVSAVNKWQEKQRRQRVREQIERATAAPRPAPPAASRVQTKKAPPPKSRPVAKPPVRRPAPALVPAPKAEGIVRARVASAAPAPAAPPAQGGFCRHRPGGSPLAASRDAAHAVYPYGSSSTAGGAEER